MQRKQVFESITYLHIKVMPSHSKMHDKLEFAIRQACTQQLQVQMRTRGHFTV